MPEWSGNQRDRWHDHEALPSIGSALPLPLREHSSTHRHTPAIDVHRGTGAVAAHNIQKAEAAAAQAMRIFVRRTFTSCSPA